MLVVDDERVAAHGHDRHLVVGRHHSSLGGFQGASCCASRDTACVKHASGARVTPAPICPTPASRCAMPVLMTGRIPVSTTLRASMPAGVPPKLSAGSVNALLRPSVICVIANVLAIASCGVPPTNFTIAGAAAIAKPPTPAVSVIALSPRSGAASAML